MADRDDKGAKRWRQKSDKGKRLIGTQRRGPSKSVQKGRWNKACCPSKESTVSPIWDFKWILARSAQSRRAGTSVEFHRGAARALADGKVAKAFLLLSRKVFAAVPLAGKSLSEDPSGFTHTPLLCWVSIECKAWGRVVCFLALMRQEALDLILAGHSPGGGFSGPFAGGEFSPRLGKGGAYKGWHGPSCVRDGPDAWLMLSGKTSGHRDKPVCCLCRCRSICRCPRPCRCPCQCSCLRLYVYVHGHVLLEPLFGIIARGSSCVRVCVSMHVCLRVCVRGCLSVCLRVLRA